MNESLFSGSLMPAARSALALRSLGVRGPAPSDAEPRGTPGVPHDEMLQEKFRVTSPEIRHPLRVLGASSFLVTLLSALRQNNLRRGVAAICIGGGEATAMAVECLY